jgi:hypothetical protein
MAARKSEVVTCNERDRFSTTSTEPVVFPIKRYIRKVMPAAR